MDAPIGDHDGLKEARKVREDGKPATTAVRVIGTSPSEVLSERGVPAAFMEEEWRSPERVSGASLVSCLPKTGEGLPSWCALACRPVGLFLMLACLFSTPDGLGHAMGSRGMRWGIQ